MSRIIRGTIKGSLMVRCEKCSRVIPPVRWSESVRALCVACICRARLVTVSDITEAREILLRFPELSS